MASLGARLRAFLVNLVKEFQTRDALPLLMIAGPILFLMAIDPVSFTLVSFVGREIGRAGFVFLFFLIAWDFHDSREQLKLTSSKSRQYASFGVLLAVLVFYSYVDVFNIDSMRVCVTSQLGVSQKSTLSFFAASDFIMFAVYCLTITSLLYSPTLILRMPTPVIYSVGSGILASLDAYFPENSLAFLQAWVPTVWNIVVFLLSLMGFHTTANPNNPAPPTVLFLPPNVLSIWGFKGVATLAIYWPSSGIVSMIIYSLVIVVLMVKVDAPRKRKLLYATIGAIGTYFVNIFRITLIVLYVAYISSVHDLVEAFHQSIGDILFIAWIFLYLFLIIRLERARGEHAVPASPTSDSQNEPPFVQMR